MFFILTYNNVCKKYTSITVSYLKHIFFRTMLFTNSPITKIYFPFRRTWFIDTLIILLSLNANTLPLSTGKKKPLTFIIVIYTSIMERISYFDVRRTILRYFKYFFISTNNILFKEPIR